jgi:hypothetical protein
LCPKFQTVERPLPVPLHATRPSRRPFRPGLKALSALLAAVGALGVAAAPAAALPDGYVYEMVSPPDKNDGSVGVGAMGAGQYRASADGSRLVYMALGGFGDAPANGLTGGYLAIRGDDFWTSHSVLLPQAPYALLGGASAQGVSRDFTRFVSQTNIDLATGTELANPEVYVLDPVTRDVERLPLDPLDGIYSANSPLQGEVYGSPDYSELILTSRQNALPDASGTGPKIYRYANGTLTLESRMPGESPSQGQFQSPSSTNRASNPVATDGKVFYFFTSSRVYRRDLRGANPETVFIHAEENDNEEINPGNATFVGASADGMVAYFFSNQRLVEEDTDSQNDIYQYDHSKPAGSRLTLVSVDNEPDDTASATGNTLGVTDDGDTIYFLSNSQLVDGETTAPGAKLFAWHDGELRFLALTGTIQGRNTVMSPNGEYFGFISAESGITPDDNGGQAQAYVYEVATGEIVCVSCVSGGANTQPAAWSQEPALGWFEATQRPVRNIANDGRVFFETAEALVGADTNGMVDVYSWKNGEVDLISSGRSRDHSYFMDASVDGSTVFFVTREQLSGWDFDDQLDAYAARLGGGLPEPPEPHVPCSGDDCQGPPALPPIFPSLGSKVEHPGNPDPGPVDCTQLKRKANKLAKQAKQLRRKARKASGKKAKRLRKRANKVSKQAKAASSRYQLCREEAEL